MTWVPLLLHWAIEIAGLGWDEGCLAALLDAGITSREHIDEVAADLMPYRAGRNEQPFMTLEMIPAGYRGLVVEFDGSPKLKTNAGSASFFACELPAWVPIHAKCMALTDVTINESEYSGLLAELDWARCQGTTDLLVVEDSRLMIEQCQVAMTAQ
ncbi:hypothetical protein PybrP1_013176 [[Pythium] brassicae (nom. inval.)]|nr:hypothetical protein PybrP1_013176 [[Pythium] brassicae (nom. inval.)]